jgi:hypothetical protein
LYGVIPYNIGAVLGIAGGALGDAVPLSGNIEICVLTFVIKTLGVHWWYIDKDPSNYGNNPADWPTPYLTVESEFASVHFPYCVVEVYPEATLTNYGVAWSANPYFAPPSPYSGSVLNAVLITAPPTVGGIYIPVNKLSLLAPYIGLTILLAVALITVGYVKKRKRHTMITLNQRIS